MSKVLTIIYITALLLLNTGTPAYAENPTNQGFMFGYSVAVVVVKI